MSRNQIIAKRYEAGEKLESIATDYGISRQRVEQIARGQSCPRREPNKNPKGQPTDEEAERRAKLEGVMRQAPAIIDLGPQIWCDQCQRQIRQWQARECDRAFCKAKVA